MIPVNPWVYYIVNEPDKLPDLNLYSEENTRELIAGIIGAVVSLMAYIASMLLIGAKFKMEVAAILYVPCTLLFAWFTVLTMKLSFKIAEKIENKKRKYEIGRISKDHN